MTFVQKPEARVFARQDQYCFLLRTLDKAGIKIRHCPYVSKAWEWKATFEDSYSTIKTV